MVYSYGIAGRRRKGTFSATLNTQSHGSRKQIDTVKEFMTKQAYSIGNFVKQAGLMDELSEEITVASRDQNTAMEQNIVTISRLSEIAQEIAQSSMMISSITGSINSRIHELGELVKNIE